MFFRIMVPMLSGPLALEVFRFSRIFWTVRKGMWMLDRVSSGSAGGSSTGAFDVSISAMSVKNLLKASAFSLSLDVGFPSISRGGVSCLVFDFLLKKSLTSFHHSFSLLP